MARGSVALAAKHCARQSLVVLLAGVLWVGSSWADSSVTGKRDEPTASAGRFWTILPESEVPRLIRPCSRHLPDKLSGAWTPSVEQVARAEAALDQALARALAATSPEQKRATMPDKRGRGGPLTYYRQYGGTMRGQTRVIYVNGMAQWIVERKAYLSKHWRKEVLRACDFALNAFGAVFDPAKGTFESFDFDYGL